MEQLLQRELRVTALDLSGCQLAMISTVRNALWQVMPFAYLQVTLCPSVLVSKTQARILHEKPNAKEFIYTIMSILWSREVLFSHSVTGKSSNAYKEKDPKPQLNAEKVNSICGKYCFFCWMQYFQTYFLACLMKL